MFISPLKRLRQSSMLGALPEKLTVPPFGQQRRKTLPIEVATLDDIAFARSALEREKDGLRRLTYGLEEVLKMARRQGACGADTAISAAVSDLEART